MVNKEIQAEEMISYEPGKVILIAEDNEVNQMVVEQTLETAGLSYHVVDNGIQAIEAYRCFLPRMVLMDVSMPEMNGLEATQAIRAIEVESGQHVPILGLTAHALKGDREMCLDAGMDDYMAKPISPDKLLRMVAQWMQSIAQGNFRGAA